MIELELPYPPSNNTYYRHARGRNFISAKGKKFLEDVRFIALSKKANKKLSCRLTVSILANPPDKRKRDIDNLFKAVLDGLTKGNVIKDDSLIDKLSISRGEVVKGGSVLVRISEA